MELLLSPAPRQNARRRPTPNTETDEVDPTTPHTKDLRLADPG